MKTITLLAMHGEFVAEVRIPPFQTDPAVLIWGSRTFVRLDHNVYAEVFCYAIP